MAAPDEPQERTKVPTHAAHTELNNRIALSLARFSGLTGLRKTGPAASSARKTGGVAAGGAPSTSATTTTSSFTSLKAGSKTSAAAPAAPEKRSRRAAAAGDESDDEDKIAVLRSAVGAPNAGLGHVPAAATTAAAAASKADEKLRARLLGRAGARSQPGADRNASSKKRRLEDEDSDDDEEQGRTALGRKKRPTVAVVADATAVSGNDGDDKEQADNADGNVNKENISAAAEQQNSRKAVPDAVYTRTQLSNSGDNDAASGKKKRKKNKSKPKNGGAKEPEK